MKKRLAILLFFLVIGAVLVDPFHAETEKVSHAVVVVVERGDTAAALAGRLKESGMIGSPLAFRVYSKWRGIDRRLVPGAYTIAPPLSIARIVSALSRPESRAERTITIIPGWDLRDIAGYFESEGIASSTEIYRLAGEPARLASPAFGELPRVLSGKPSNVSLEGYLAPNTYRVYTDATVEDILQKLLLARADELDGEVFGALAESGRNAHEILTIASIVEREVQTDADRATVADIFWRRLDAGWGLQADSTVHYVAGKKGDVFTTKEDRARENLWNTYKFAGLPPGPISNPGLASIRAALSPKENDYWYFLTTLDGDVKYAKTFEEHNRNVAKYLRE